MPMADLEANHVLCTGSRVLAAPVLPPVWARRVEPPVWPELMELPDVGLSGLSI